MDFIAVVIGIINHGQHHIGILHRSKNDSPECLHLAWHCKLENEVQFNFASVWIQPNIPLPRQRIIAALCRRVWRKNEKGGIPYAFSNPENSFNPQTGQYLIGPSCYGLTCASFVLALFETGGFPLAKCSTWPSDRSGDDIWQKKIIKSLEGRATQEHIEKIQNEIGAVRYRPEEVAACSAIIPPAGDFPCAEKMGKLIVKRMQQLANSAT